MHQPPWESGDASTLLKARSEKPPLITDSPSALLPWCTPNLVPWWCTHKLVYIWQPDLVHNTPALPKCCPSSWAQSSNPEGRTLVKLRAAGRPVPFKPGGAPAGEKCTKMNRVGGGNTVTCARHRGLGGERGEGRSAVGLSFPCPPATGLADELNSTCSDPTQHPAARGRLP